MKLGFESASNYGGNHEEGGQAITAVLDFWTNAGPDKWFAKDDAFDVEFRSRFLELHLAAASRELDSWADDPRGALALLLLLDQFPRNAFRGTGHMYATDSLAKMFATTAVTRGFDMDVEASLRLFFYLPFSHSEDLADQERAVELHKRINYTKYAIEHLDVVKRFGRFPHRNLMLGRETTVAEKAFLDEGGFAG